MMRVSLVVVGLSLAVLAGCTSFEFKHGGRDSAPGDLMSKDRMVKIPGGTYAMGAQEGETDEFPPHKVEISTFWLDKTEVTIGDYTRCVHAHACRPAVLSEDDKQNMPKDPDHYPVVGVSWYDAQRYCSWVGKRLPTEAEWEYAARAPKLGKFPFEGIYEASLANTAGTKDGYERTAPVGSFPKGASGYGVLDMAGNAAEWTADWYDAVTYKDECGRGVGNTPADAECRTVKDPTGPKIDTGSKVVRGGSWTSNGDYLIRATSRVSLEPNVSNDAVGFRCAI